MRKKYERVDILQIVLGVLAAILLIITLTNQSFEKFTNIVFILIALNLIITGIKSFKERRNSLFPYTITLLALIIIGVVLFK